LSSQPYRIDVKILPVGGLGIRKAPRDVGTEPHAHMESKRIDFFMVIMVSGIACECVQMTATPTESRKMVAILQLKA